MVEERELFSMLLSTAVLALAYRSRRSLAYLESFPLLLASITLLAAGFIATVLEGLFWSIAFNILEHAAYGASSVLLALWAWTTWMQPRRKGS